MQKNISFHLTVSALIVFGALLIVSPRLSIFNSRTSATTFAESYDATSDEASPTVLVQQKSGKPIHMIISSVDVDIPVVDGIYNESKKTWSLSNDKAHYALMTPQANNTSGNTFIYGHNRREVFSRLSRLNPGDIAIVTTENGFEFIYEFQQSITTQPYDDTLFRYKGPPILTLQTCSGLWYQDRSLYTFSLKDVREANNNAF